MRFVFGILLALMVAVMTAACAVIGTHEPPADESPTQITVEQTETANPTPAPPSASPTPRPPSSVVYGEITRAMSAASSLDVEVYSALRPGLLLVPDFLGLSFSVSLYLCPPFNPRDLNTGEFLGVRSESVAAELWPEPYANVDDAAARLCNTLVTTEASELSEEEFLDAIDSSGHADQLSDALKALRGQTHDDLREAITERE